MIVRGVTANTHRFGQRIGISLRIIRVDFSINSNVYIVKSEEIVDHLDSIAFSQETQQNLTMTTTGKQIMMTLISNNNLIMGKLNCYGIIPAEWQITVRTGLISSIKTVVHYRNYPSFNYSILTSHDTIISYIYTRNSHIHAYISKREDDL